MTEDRDVTRIETLRLLNYRRFAETLIDFDPRLTVLISPNGHGNTAIQAQPQGGRLSGDDVRPMLGPERTMERAYLSSAPGAPPRTSHGDGSRGCAPR